MKNTRHAIKNAADQVGEQVKVSKGDEYGELAKNAFQGNVSIKSLAGIPDEKEEAIYAQGFLLYNTGRYKEAAEIFRVLIAINATEPKHMMGLAACFHMMKAYDSAIATYMICAFLDPKNPIPSFHLSDCYLQVDDPISAAAALKVAIENAEGKPEFNTLRERAEITLKGLKKIETEEKKTVS